MTDALGGGSSYRDYRESPTRKGGATAEREPARVAILCEPEPKQAPKVDGVYRHDAFCGCDWCDAPAEPRYARAGRKP